MLRAIGVVRVSQVGGRGDRFVSPEEQQERIQAVCDRENFKLLETFPELDVSGGAPLMRRPGLRRAVDAVEQGRADVIVVAYFDRLVRSVKVQQEVVERVEAAGGRIALADFGNLTNGTAVQWLSGTLIGAVSEYVRRSIAERSAAGQQVALEQGRWPVRLIPGFRQTESGIELDTDTCLAMTEAFRMRAAKPPATIWQVRDHLAENGIERSYHGVSGLLRNRQAVGEVRFGDRVGSIPALIDIGTFERVQKIAAPRGPKAKSDRLLARLGVLRCGTCDSRMTTGTQTHQRRKYAFYRCSGKRGKVVDDCTQRATISAVLVEQMVVDEVKELIAGMTGTASAKAGVAEAAAQLERTQAELSGAIAAFASAGVADEPEAVEGLAALRKARDQARDRHDELVADLDATEVAVTAGAWDGLTLQEQRDLIRAVIERVVIAPSGRGAERVFIKAKVR